MLKQFITNTMNAIPATQTQTLPVFASSPSRGPMFLGLASSHSEAEALGLVAGISCDKISRAHLNGDERTFFVLH